MDSKAREFLSKDKYIGPLVEEYGPIDVAPRKKSQYFISLVRAITNQQLSGKAAGTIFKRFEAKVGKVKPENILAEKDEELRACGLSWAKVKYVKDLSERVVNCKLKLENLDQLPDDEVERELVAVKGIGPWSAEMFLMFTLGRADIFPADDLGIRNGMKKILNKDLSQKELATFAERWRPYRTYAAEYIWANLDNR